MHCADDRMLYVQLQGQDHDFDGIRIETKYSGKSLISAAGTYRRNMLCGPIKIKNTQHTQKTCVPETFDYLLLIDSLAAAVCPFQFLNTYTWFPSDGIYIKNLPYQFLTWIVRPGEYEIVNRDVALPSGIIRAAAARIINEAMAIPSVVKYTGSPHEFPEPKPYDKSSRTRIKTSSLKEDLMSIGDSEPTVRKLPDLLAGELGS
jgi:hypothetical protein